VSRIRFSIASLLGLVVFVAIAAAAVRAASDLWDSSLFSATLGVLLTAVLLAVHRTERKRAYWLGFALAGSTYLGASLIPSIGSRLITTRCLTYISSWRTSQSPGWVYDINVSGPMTSAEKAASRRSAVKLYRIVDPQRTYVQALIGLSVGSTENFLGISHSLIALSLAFLGGHVSRYIYVRGPTQ
jgi:hypothetical protein